MQSEPIVSCIRIKPCLKKEEGELICIKNDEKSVLLTKTNEKYTFEYVFDELTNNQEIFNQLCQSLIDECFKGINVCIFAYGQTSSGKTFTMKGSQQNPGIIPISFSYIFSKIKENDTFQVEVKCSYLELYNETLNDLLNKDNINLDIREHNTKGIFIQNLSEFSVKNEEEALEYFNKGEELRKFGETSLNTESSRSHTVFRIQFEIRPKNLPEKIYFSFLNLVDLAGSEGITKSKTEGARKKEGSNINKSLLALSNVINKLSLNNSTFINYRDSKLTRILQPSLGGNSKNAVICTINGSLNNFQETISTLKFGINAGAIKNQILINEKTKIELLVNDKDKQENIDLKNTIILKDEQLQNLRQTVSQLEMNLEINEEKLQNNEQNYGQLKNEIESYQNEINNLKLSINHLNIEKENLRRNNENLINIVQEYKTQEEKFESEKKRIENNNLYEEKSLKLNNENKILKDKLNQIIFQFKEELKNKDNKINELNSEIKILKTSLENTKLIKMSPSPNKENNKNIGNIVKNELNISKSFEILRKPNESLILPQNKSLLDEDLEYLELSYNLNSKIFQKNKVISTLYNKIIMLEKENKEKDDSLFELKNDIIYYKSIYGDVAKNISVDPMENISLNVSKKRKIDDYSFVEKRIQNSPDKNHLKREIRYLENKTKNYEKQLNKKKLFESETFKRMEMLLKNKINLEHKLQEKSFTVDSFGDI